MSSRLTPNEPFPEDLTNLPTAEVEVLNSKIHRELDFEHRHDGEAEPETEFRLEDLNDELDARDLLADIQPAAERRLSVREHEMSAAHSQDRDEEPDAEPDSIWV